MLEIFFLIILIIHFAIFLSHSNNKYNKFILISSAVNILFYLIVKFKLPSILKAEFHFPKTLSYLIFLTLFVFIWLELRERISKFGKNIFLVTLLFFSLSVSVEYLNALHLLFIPQNEIVEDVLMYCGFLSWIFLYTYLYIKIR